MKKTIFLFKPHSMVDIITNSSSELFICETDKTVGFIENFIDDFNNISDTNSLCDVYQITNENVEDFILKYIVGWYVKRYIWSSYHLIEDFERKTNILKRQFRYIGDDYKEHNKQLDKEIETYTEKWLTDNMETLKKDLIGNIIIISSDDNSMDSAIFSALEDLFDAYRFHLG